MAENKNFSININGDGEVRISEEVVGIIAGLAATEVDGVESLAGNLTSDTIAKAGAGKLSKALRVIETDEGKLIVRLSINLSYGFEIPAVCAVVQDKVKAAIENMTGLEVVTVDIRIAAVNMA